MIAGDRRDERASRGVGPWLLCLAVAAGTGLLAWSNLAMLQHPGWIVPIWVPNGAVLALLILRRGRGRMPILGAAFVGNLLATLTSQSPAAALALAGCNLVEVMAACAVISRGDPARDDLMGTAQGLSRFCLATGALGPGLSGVAAVALGAAGQGMPHWEAWTTWVLTHGLGNLIIAPIVLVAADLARGRHELNSGRLAEWMGIMLIGTALTVGVFAQDRFPFLFLAAPFVLAAAFRLGIAGAAISTLIVTVVASAGTAMGHGPIRLVVGGADVRLLTLQIFLLATFVSALPVAVALRQLARARGALWEGEQRLRIISELTPVGIVRTDAQGNMTHASDAWLQLTGMKLERVLGTGWATELYGSEAASALKVWRDLIIAAEPFQREFQFYDSAKAARWVMTYGSPEYDGDHNITGFTILVLDITERKQAERKLAERERDLSLFASNVSDAVFRLDLEGKCRFVTPSVSKVLGYAPEALLGQQMLARFHPDDVAESEERFRQMVAGEVENAVVTYRARHAQKPGWVWLEASCAVVRDAKTGAPREIVASLRDVTERKEMESALKLERARAEGAAQAKSRFLANMSHEIRTPMNGVIGFTDLLLQSELNPRQQDQLRMIAESGRTMMQILNEILDHSKIEAGQMVIARERVDLPHAIRRSARLFESAARQKGLELEVEIDLELPRWISADGLRLRQIVTNLIGNAVKFTQEGSVRLDARVLERDGARLLELDVRDTGCGIAEDQLEAIFGEFVQAEQGAARWLGGTGLGLSISRHLAQLMGGDISVRSTLGEGSCFRLTLPLTEADPREEPASPLAPLPQTEGPYPGRVLAAEDNPINRRLIVAMLEQVGIACDTAPDGREAFAAVLRAEAAGQPYDLVLMDLQMPTVDGYESVRMIRAAGIAAERLPVIALTANAYEEDVRAAHLAGMQAHLAKPIEGGELLRVLKRWARVPVDAIEPDPGPQLDALRPELRERLKLARAAVAAARRKRAGEAQWSELRSRCHQLAGNASLFGYAALGDSARLTDRLITAGDSGSVLEAAIALFDRYAKEALAAEARRARRRQREDAPPPLEM